MYDIGLVTSIVDKNAHVWCRDLKKEVCIPAYESNFFGFFSKKIYSGGNWVILTVDTSSSSNSNVKNHKLLSAVDATWPSVVLAGDIFETTRLIVDVVVKSRSSAFCKFLGCNVLFEYSCDVIGATCRCQIERCRKSSFLGFDWKLQPGTVMIISGRPTTRPPEPPTLKQTEKEVTNRITPIALPPVLPTLNRIEKEDKSEQCQSDSSSNTAKHSGTILQVARVVPLQKEQKEELLIQSVPLDSSNTVVGPWSEDDIPCLELRNLMNSSRREPEKYPYSRYGVVTRRDVKNTFLYCKGIGSIYMYSPHKTINFGEWYSFDIMAARNPSNTYFQMNCRSCVCISAFPTFQISSRIENETAKPKLVVLSSYSLTSVENKVNVAFCGEVNVHAADIPFVRYFVDKGPLFLKEFVDYELNKKTFSWQFVRVSELRSVVKKSNIPAVDPSPLIDYIIKLHDIFLIQQKDAKAAIAEKERREVLDTIVRLLNDPDFCASFALADSSLYNQLTSMNTELRTATRVVNN